MNAKQKKIVADVMEKIESALALAQEALELLEPVRDDLAEKVDSMSDKARESERGQEREAENESVGGAFDEIVAAVSSLTSVAESLDAVGGE